MAKHRWTVNLIALIMALAVPLMTAASAVGSVPFAGAAMHHDVLLAAPAHLDAEHFDYDDGNGVQVVLLPHAAIVVADSHACCDTGLPVASLPACHGTSSGEPDSSAQHSPCSLECCGHCASLVSPVAARLSPVLYFRPDPAGLPLVHFPLSPMASGPYRPPRSLL